MCRRVLRKVWKNEKIRILDAPRHQNALYNLGLTPDFYRTFGYPSQFSTVYLIPLPIISNPNTATQIQQYDTSKGHGHSRCQVLRTQTKGQAPVLESTDHLYYSF